MFRDERFMGVPSKAVERENRWDRKLEQTVYRVWTRGAIESRLGRDLQRERQGDGRAEMTRSLHQGRAA